MSTVVQPQTRVKAQETAKVRVGLWDLVRAELTRSRRTFTWGVIGATLIFTVHTIIHGAPVERQCPGVDAHVCRGLRGASGAADRGDGPVA